MPWVLLVIGFGVKGRCVASPWMKLLNPQRFRADIWKRWKGSILTSFPAAFSIKALSGLMRGFLGIDEDQAVADYSTASNEQPEPENKFPLEIHDEPNRELNPRRSNFPLIFAVAALVGVLVGYGFWIKSKPHNPAPVENTRQSAPASAASEPQANAPTPPATPSSPELTNNSSQAAAAKQAPAESTATPRPVERRREAVSSESANAPASAKEVTFLVQVKAKEDSWVSIVADGKSVMQRVLTADKHKNIKAGKILILRTGNAGGIEVSFNGRHTGSSGK